MMRQHLRLPVPVDRHPDFARGRVGHVDGHQHQQPAGERDILLRCAHDERGQHAHQRELADHDPARSRSLGHPSIASQGVSVDADSGTLNTNIDLPSYNPTVPALSLTYNSMTANPLPIVTVHDTLDPTQAVPTAVAATLTFNSVAGTTWYYNTSTMTPGDVQQIALQANATSLSTGRYSYSVQLVDERSANTTLTYTGTATVLNQSSSAFGDGWTVEGLEQIIPAGTSGVILSLGNNGESLFFAGNPSVSGNYTTPAGNFSTLTLTSSGYTQTLPDGTQVTFNSSGYETATIDLNNNHTTYSYNGSNQLTSIEDQYGGPHDPDLQLGPPEHDRRPGGATDDLHLLGQRSRGRRAGRWLARDVYLRRLGPHDAGGRISVII